MPDADEHGPPSPLEAGSEVGSYRVGPRFGVRGDVHLHRGATLDLTRDVRIAAWRYRGAEPLPRFLDQLREDAERWSVFHADDGRMPLVVPTLEVARRTGQMTCYWVQDDPRGPTLAERLDHAPKFSPAYAVDLARKLGEALTQIHDAGLVHGDLDPNNVHLSGNFDLPRLAWGGMALRLERAGVDAGRGTVRGLAEVAPEVLLGSEPDARADLFGLCALLFRMLAGQPPWLVRKNGPIPGATDVDPLPPLPEWVTAPLPQLLAVGLRRDPNERPDTVADWVDRLAQLAPGLAELPAPPGTWAPPSEEGTVPTPPTVNRTVSPIERIASPDPALSNVPRGWASTPIGPIRSVVPAMSRGDLGGSTWPPMPALAPPVSLPPAQAPSPVPHAATSVEPPPQRSSQPSQPRAAQPRAAPPKSAPPMSLPPYTEPAGSRGPVMLAGLVVVLFPIVVLALVCGMPHTVQIAQAPAPAPAPAPIAAPSVATNAEPSAPAAPAVLTIRTEPPNAEVLENGVKIGYTPAYIKLTGGPTDPPRRFELHRPGYRRRMLEQPWTASAVEVVYSLEPLPAAEPEPPPLPPMLQDR